MTTQRVAKDDVISFGGDTFIIVTTHIDVSLRNQAITEDAMRQMQKDYGKFFPVS
jgi:hypothetical protein